MKFPHIEWRTSSHSTQQGNCVEVGAWRTSSHSGKQGNCVELGAWRKSSHSTGNGGQCVEVATGETIVLARDSKDPDGPVLGFGADAWAVFLNTVKSGHLDLA
ncbi:DUF397 domain-containing protein [Actinomadura geliboluensis]|uniref:DUF397 domain-containing protein n=1 Tax=Actinomadura geliboluensis TaxID=882440 RepID=A0A5S4H882_9ACTN|nr:DUF397 domain-containing protein [Actinomadura geliboluensis]TMR41465.1 DUF397 domain-containing protein [Actinomadura geliboluensis]